MAELALRQLMHTTYTGAYGSDWVDKIANPERLARWRERRSEDEAVRRRRGSSPQLYLDIDYSDFSELLSIAWDHWEPLADALGKRKKYYPMLERLGELRNSVAHSRPLLPFERDLISGIAGELRNRVTIYMSAKDDAGEYYPRIERVNDNYGNTIEEMKRSFPASLPTEVTLRPGDVLTSQCRATDPHNRPLRWTLEMVTPPGRDDTALGDDVELSVIIRDEHVSERNTVAIKMATEDAPYHRDAMRGCDGYVMFSYRVRPPLGFDPAKG